MSNITEDEKVKDRNSGVVMVIMAGMLAEYGGRMLKGNAKIALEGHVNGIIKHAARIEKIFTKSESVTIEEREKLKLLFDGNVGALYAEHLQVIFGLSEDSMEAVMRVVNRFINDGLEEKKSPAETGPTY